MDAPLSNVQKKRKLYSEVMDRLQRLHILSDLSEGDKLLHEYQLSKIPVDDIDMLRKSGIPGFILKQTIIPGHPEYWYSPVSEKFSLVAKKWFPHNCGDCAILGTKEGSSPERCAWGYTIKQAVQIEKFDYLENAVITFGFHCKIDVLKINVCKHFTPYPDEPKYLTDLRAQS